METWSGVLSESGEWAEFFGDDLGVFEGIAVAAGDDEVANGGSAAEVPGVNVVDVEGVVVDFFAAVLALAVISFVDSKAK